MATDGTPDGRLAALVRMHDAHAAALSLSSASETEGSSSQSRGDPGRLTKAYEIVATAARDGDRLKKELAKTLQSETAVGRSAYATDVTFHSLVQAVFWALNAPRDSQEGEKLRAAVFALVLQLVHTTNAAGVAQRIVVVLLQELHSLRLSDLASAVSELIRGVINSPRAQQRGGDSLAVFYTIELLPQLLLRVTSSMTLSFEVSQCDSIEGDLSGPDYRQRVLTKLTSLSWPRRFFLQVLKSFRDFTLTQDEERSFCIKIYREARKELSGASDQARTLEVFPTVCLSVLQLVGRTQNGLCTRLLTRLLINKCQQLTAATSERGGGTSFLNAGTAELTERELRALQSTVLYHVDMAMRQWERLGKAMIVEYEQRSPQRLSSFDLALLLLIASHSKYEASVMLLLLRYVVDTYKTQWTRSTDGHEEAMSRKAFMSVVQHAQDGNWTLIVDQMIALGFRLIEYRGLKGDLNANPKSGTVDNSASCPPNWADFGVRLLLACFQHHIAVREKVLDRVVNMIIVQNADCLTYIHVISRIVKRHIAELGGSLETRIRECLEYVTHMQSEHANTLLVALSPLLKTQHNLKNFVILMLRKAMFRKDEGSRIIAIQGLALLLCLSSRIFSRSRTLSQLYSQNVTMMSQGISGTSSMHHASAVDSDIASQEHAHALVAEDLYRQFCGIFRRALQLQTRVRVVLYAELIKVFTECPALQQSILKLLFQHYQKYYEFNESVQPPLKLDLSLSRKRGVYEEPLPYLLHTMLHCFREVKKEEVDTEEEEETMMDDIPATQAGGANQVVDTIEQNIAILFERLKRCELSDFEFDKNASFIADTELGDTNRRLARLVLGILQVAINWSVVGCHQDGATGDEVSGQETICSVWEVLLRYAQVYSWIQRRLLDSPGGPHKQTLATKKRKLLKPPLILDAGKSGRPSTDRSLCDEQELVGSFERSASLHWATLLAPDMLLRILDFAAKKGRSGDGRPSLTPEEEDFTVLVAEKGNCVLDLIQIKLAQSSNDETKYQKQRRSSDSVHQFDHHRFTRRLCEVFLKLLRIYCNEEVSLVPPTGSATRKRASGEEAKSQERMRQLVRVCVQGFVQIAEMWSLQPFEEFEEQLTRTLCAGAAADEGSPDYDFGGEESDGIMRVLQPLQQLIDELISQEMADEANRLLDVVQIVWSKVPTELLTTSAFQQSTAWVKDMLVSRPGNASPRLLEKLVVLLLRPQRTSTFQFEVAKQLAVGLRFFCNSGGEDADETTTDATPPVIQFRRLNEKHVLTVANSMLGNIDQALAETERSIKGYVIDQRRHDLKFKEDDLSALQQLEDETGSQVFRSDVDAGASSGVATFKRLCKQMFELAGSLRPFVAMSLNSPVASIRIVRLVGRLYKLLVLIVRDKVRRKDASLPKYMRQLFDTTAGSLSPALLQFIACIQEDSARSGETKKRISKMTGATTNMTGKSKFIPDVIFQLEQYDLAMIKLSKLCKAHDFNTWCKLRPSRDFRLNKERIKQSLNDANMKKRDETNEQGTGSGSDGEGGNLTSEDTVTEFASTANAEEDDGDSGNDDTESAEDEQEEASVEEAPVEGRGKKRRARAIAVDSDGEDHDAEDEDAEEEEEEIEIEEIEEEEHDVGYEVKEDREEAEDDE